VADAPPYPLAPQEGPDWRKHRKLAARGLRDLEYLPRSRTGWNATLAAHAFSVRRRLAGQADLNLWAAMRACPPSARYERLGRDALVLWHGTSAARAEKIARHGLFHKRGVWATVEPRIAHGYTRGRSSRFSVGSAMVVLVLDGEDMPAAFERQGRGGLIFRFHAALPPECVEYVLYDDRIEFVGGERAERPRPWGAARFKKRHGRWVPCSRPPVRFEEDHTYRTLDEWLELSIRRVLATLGPASGVEVFSCLYATIEPTEALEHRAIFAALDRLCGKPRPCRGGTRLFALKR